MKKETGRILKMFLSGQFSPETEEAVQRWIITNRDEKEKEKASGEYWNELPYKTDSYTYTAWKRINARIGYSARHTITLYKKITRIAAVLIPFLILTMGGYLYYHSVNDRLVEISVPLGKEKQLFLPDSSQIWLNAGTTIRYTEKFRGKQRLIYLDGEAYFSVMKNENKPFIVETGQLSVKVLGTEFNLKAYSADDKTITTLARGQVEINTNSGISKILKPNEQLTYHKTTSAIQIAEVVPEESSAWITGQLIFSGSTLEDMIKTLEKRFNISIENNTSIPLSKVYTIKFVKGENPDEILHVIADVIGITYQKEENKIILNNKE